MKIVSVQRETKYETRFHEDMGCLQCRVTTIRRMLFGFIPLQQIHRYRETYYGEVKDVESCRLSR